MDATDRKPGKTAEELHVELEWAAHVLTGDDSSGRIAFALPTLARPEDLSPDFNWDVDVSCRPDQDDAAQAAILHVATKWNLVTAQEADRAMPILVTPGSGRAAAARAVPASSAHPVNGQRRRG